ncbi:HTH cro/C1-type domain-containing protein, partial [Dysosmobacter welbionis]
RSVGPERVHHRQPGDGQCLPCGPVHGGCGGWLLRRRGHLRHPAERCLVRGCPQRPGARRCSGEVSGLPGPDGGRQLYAVRFIPANHCGSIQMPGWSRFPPCPGNFCPTVERGLQCRALDGGQPL